MGEPDVHALAAGTADPLFRPVGAHVGHPDHDLAVASVLGRTGGDPGRIDRAYSSQIAKIRAILSGPAGPPAPAFDAPTEVVPGDWSNMVAMTVGDEDIIGF